MRKFRGQSSSCRAGHTTFAQFFANVLYIPFGFAVFNWIFTNFWYRAIFFPLNIWALEIVEGYIFIALYGKNLAWFYGTPDALCHGNIRIGYATLWILLGLTMELSLPHFIPIATQFAELISSVP